jgi:hypothetical protein
VSAFIRALRAEAVKVEAWDMGNGSAEIRITVLGDDSPKRMMALFEMMKLEVGGDTDMAEQGSRGDQGAGGGG